MAKFGLKVVKTLEYIFNVVLSLGLAGGIFAVIFGPLFILWRLELWLLMPKGSAVRSWLESQSQDQWIVIGLFMLSTGIAVLISRTGKVVEKELERVRKWNEDGLIKNRLANACQTGLMSRREGIDFNAIDSVFDEFLLWAADEDRVSLEGKDEVRHAWAVHTGKMILED